ncbi:hypothetical protein GGX14DRAFT_587015 [Mycena pura]|uniref:Uncharacterized protein n=1 Tax=Mycena pura TaxID=153505 RepID=A0AAD6UUP3_9AGAR|nr:hypothetical protein GGX14DRAFT_587015 [Mycena pura]
MALISRSGLALPLPVNFDFVAYKTRGADVLPPDTHDLADINADNVQREAGNKASIKLTFAYETALASAARPASPLNEDVSYPLLPFFTYSDQQKHVLVGDKEVVAASGPLPLFMTLFIANERLNTQQAKDADKAKNDADRARRFTRCRKKQGSSSSFWMIRQATDFPHTISTTTILGPQVPGSAQTLGITVIHVAKNMNMLHDEDISRLTPGIWRQASRNMLESFKQLCPAVVPGDPVLGHTHASKYAEHVLFFANLSCFEEAELFPVWYQVEHELRYEIYSSGLFDHFYYEQRINIALTTYNMLAHSALPRHPPATLPVGSAPYKMRIPLPRTRDQGARC